MVGIVIVSHSATLAEGVRELAEQMVQGKVPMAVAGGIDDPENPIGTDAMKVYEAIQSVFSEDGVVVLMDLGSALLSAETALEFLEPELQEKVILSAAPLVEGTMAAAVQASIGASREQVAEEAVGALSAKRAQLGELEAESESAAAEEEPVDSVETLTLTVHNRLGLHARPAAEFVRTANSFGANIRVRKGNEEANAKSINQVATLGVRQGEQIVVSAWGSDAREALQAIDALARKNFNEAEEQTTVVAAATMTSTVAENGALPGVAASPGVAIGPAALYRPRLPQVTEKKIEDPEQEWARLERAIATARREIEALYTQAVRAVGDAEAAIFQAHAMFLEDPSLVEAAKEQVFAAHINAEAAWQKEIAATAGRFRELEDEYMQARAADIEDVGQRVLRQLMDLEPPSLAFEQPAVLVAVDLSPSDTAQLSQETVLGICTERGGATSHSAILARALGIPAVVGLGTSLWVVGEGQQIALDGSRGRVWPHPDDAQLATLQDEQDAWRMAQEAAKLSSRESATTRDGHRIEVAANIGGPHDIAIALDYGAEGVGLFRTEFLFLDRQQAPSEEEQFAAYHQVAQALGQQPLVIRTLDIGGDKTVPYLDMGHEANPFLGWRGIRYCLDHPEIFLPQLRAVLRASHGHNVKLMFPMVGTVKEIRAAKALLAEAQGQLRQEGIPFDEAMEVGIMIEVPAAAAMADKLAVEVDFFSIGTNDLTQYTMAADRGNAHVADIAQALQPAVLRLIRQTVEAGHAAGIWVGMCGEMAGDPRATPVLVGLGLDELSMSAPSIPAVKDHIRHLTKAEAAAIAEKALAMAEMGDVTAVLAE